MTDVTCRLTAKNRDQLRNPTLGNGVKATFTFLPITSVDKNICAVQSVGWLELVEVEFNAPLDTI